MTPATRAAEKAEPEQPAEADVVEARVDDKLIEDTIAFIRKTFTDSLEKGIASVGDYVLERYFDNDPDRVRSKNPHKERSFRGLVERCETPELPISRSGLHRAVSIAAMRRALPEAKAFKQLPSSHQATLLPLREPEKIEKVAQQVVQRKLSVRKLHEIVVKEVAKAREGETRGRKPLPVITKTLNRSIKIFTLESGKRSFTKAMVDELDEEQRKNALKAAQALAASLAKLIEKLEAKS